MPIPRPVHLIGLCALVLVAPARAADFDRPYLDRPDLDRPDFDRPDFGRPALDRPRFERPDPPFRPDRPVAVRPLVEHDGYGPERGPPPAPAFRGPHFTAAPPEACREFVRRRFDPDGEPMLRRVRVCDEPDGGLGLDRAPPPPEEIPPRRWGGPRW